jgi:hypothetical protein
MRLPWRNHWSKMAFKGGVRGVGKRSSISLTECGVCARIHRFRHRRAPRETKNKGLGVAIHLSLTRPSKEHLSLFPSMQEPKAICLARSGGFAAGGAAFGAAVAEALAGEPGIKGRRAARNSFRQAVATVFGRRMVQGPSQEGVPVRFAASAAMTVRGRGRWDDQGWWMRIGGGMRLIGQTHLGSQDHRPYGQNAGHSHDDSTFLPKR